MGWLRTLVVSGAALAISGATAHAADMPGYPSLPPPPPSTDAFRIDEFVSGWYLRGDVGYRFQHAGSASDTINSYTTSTIKNAFVGGGGVGLRAQWLRADITGDYGWRSLYNGSTATGANTVSAKIETFTVMLNGYADLGTWGGFTPYVGAGIGGADLFMRNYTSSPPQVNPAPPSSRWNVAWAAMAGVSYNLTYNLLLDVGYRHVDMGKSVGGPASNPLTIKRLTGDEIRVGVRYLLD
jgi:opacity protein-like surface antigen